MKVLIVSALYTPNEIGGAEITARAVAEALVDKGYKATVVSLAPDGQAVSREIRGVKCIYLPLANLFWLHGAKQQPAWLRLLWHIIDAYNPIMGKRVGAILDEERPDVIHAHNLQGFSVAIWREAKKRRIPVVQTLHDYYLGCANSTMYRNGRNCTTPCLACRVLTSPKISLSSIPDTVTGVSNRVLNRLEARGLFKKTRSKQVIYGCNLEEPALTVRTDKRPGDNMILGFLGRIEPIKGLETLLEAFKRLNNPSLTLLIGGHGKPGYVDPLKSKYQSAEIQFLGFVNPANFFSKIDLLIVPSRWEEPLGRVIHESFSHGVPVIASKLGGMQEIIDPGKTGYLFAADDTDGLVKILHDISVYGFQASQFFKNCRIKSEEYKLEKITGDYIATLAAAAEPISLKVL